MKEKQIEILKKTLKLFLFHGIEKTSMNMIAKEVGMTKPALYYHFKNKDEIIENVLFIFSNEMTKWSKESFTDSLSPKDFLRKNFQSIVIFDDVSQILLGKKVEKRKFSFDEIINQISKKKPKVKKKMNQIFKMTQRKVMENLEECKKQNLIKADVNTEILSIQIHATIEGISVLKAYDASMDLRKIGNQLFEELWNSIKK